MTPPLLTRTHALASLLSVRRELKVDSRTVRERPVREGLEPRVPVRDYEMTVREMIRQLPAVNGRWGCAKSNLR